MTDIRRRLRSWAPAPARPLPQVCAFLALASDHRTALDIADRGHACHATTPTSPLTPTEQAALCLTARHSACPRFEARRADASGRATVEASGFTRTRLVVTPEPTRAVDHVRARARPAGVAAAAVIVAALGVGTWRAIGGANPGDLQASAQPTPAFVAGAEATERPPVTVATLAPTPTPAATEPAATPTPIATPVPSVPLTLGTPVPPTPEPERYVVQAGDTLYDIAVRFDSSVEELMTFNALESEFIEIDQVLLIP